MRVVAIIQARCGSTRFPNKVFADLCGKPFIWHVVNRLKFVHLLDHIVLATTDRPSDDKLYYWAKEEGYGNDNPGSKSQGMKQLMAGGGVALVGITLIPLLSGLFG